MFEHFFDPCGVNEPCGMYNTTHFIVSGTLIILAFVLAFIFRKASMRKLKTFILVIGIVVLLLEIWKIIFRISIGESSIMQIVPLHYCSLFIYACLLAGFGKGIIERCGMTFLATGGLAGITFLIVPNSVLPYYPLWHSLTIHSLSFHFLMFLIFLLLLFNKDYKVKLKDFISYTLFIVPCLFIATIINIKYNENLMFLTYPAEMPFDLLDRLHAASPTIFVVFMWIVYITMPFFGGYLLHKIKK